MLINPRLMALALCAAATAVTLTPATAQTVSTRPAYGCFKVSSAQANIRAGSSANADVIATAIKNETLVKRRRFCTVGGNWCAVTTNKGIQGFAAKADIKVSACPARTSTTIN